MVYGCVVVELGGRLGNILFGMATALQYAKKYGKDKVYFHIRDSIWRRYYETYTAFHLFDEWKGSLSGFTRLKNRDDYVFEELPYVDGNVYIDGSFESELWFPDKDLIDRSFVCPEELKDSIRNEYPDIEDCVGISIRRGDYLHFNKIFYVPKITWFTDLYRKHFDGRPTIVFSDDIEWVKRNIGENKNFRFYDNAHTSDMYMIKDPNRNIFTMAMCRDHICSHSTWAWWGCRLLEREGSVNIFHDKRFKPTHPLDESNYIPDRWIKEVAEYE